MCLNRVKNALFQLKFIQMQNKRMTNGTEEKLLRNIETRKSSAEIFLFAYIIIKILANIPKGFI